MSFQREDHIGFSGGNQPPFYIYKLMVNIPPERVYTIIGSVVFDEFFARLHDFYHKMLMDTNQYRISIPKGGLFE